MIGEKSYIHTNVKFMYYKNFNIGNHSHIGYSAHIDNRLPISIGNNVMIAPHVKIITLGHNLDKSDFCAKGAEVFLKDNSVVFYGAMILPGVIVGEGAVIMAGSVVVKNVEPYSIVGGNPAKHIRFRTKELDYEINQGQWFSC